MLAMNQVVVVGGVDGSGAPLSSAEVYDPASDTWSTTGSISAPAVSC